MKPSSNKPGSDSPAADDLALAEFVSQFYDDPLGFVLACFPWGEPGSLRDHDGPDTWQREFLEWLGKEVKARAFDGVHAVDPIQGAVSSGHGIGKSTLQAWIVCWIMSTRPRCHGTVTANTATQLDTKTWASVQKWAKLCITSGWFEINTERMYRKGQRDSWFCAPQSCREENSEAFAGQHALDSTSFYIFDEDSAVPDAIHQVAEGGMTDGEPMQFRFGNPTRSSGSFYRCAFGSERHRWHVQVVDSRQSKFTNKAKLNEWVEDYGEDSDFVRVRVRGLPPAASDLQYISSTLVEQASKREAICLPDDPLVCGLDVARGGQDECVFWFRRGADAKSVPPIRIPGQEARDSMRLVTVAADVLSRSFNGHKVAMLFVDGTGIGGPICDRLFQMGRHNVMEVQFGQAPPRLQTVDLNQATGEIQQPHHKFANMRSYIWGQMREWLKHGAIPESDHTLAQDLVAPEYFHDRYDRIVLESKDDLKARGLASPDSGDALALTFAAPVAPIKTDVRAAQRDDRDQEYHRTGRRSARGGY